MANEGCHLHRLRGNSQSACAMVAGKRRQHEKRPQTPMWIWPNAQLL